jgi:hypothetical protein
METWFLKPAQAGLSILDDVTGAPLPQEGATVPKSKYWVRRVIDGDAVEVVAKPAKEAK